jgi:hypothetical protein
MGEPTSALTIFARSVRQSPDIQRQTERRFQAMLEYFVIAARRRVFTRERKLHPR